MARTPCQSPIFLRLARTAGIAALAVLSACGGGALPKSESVTQSRWPDFAAVMADYEKVVPGATTSAELRALGFDPLAAPNMRVLNYLDIMRHFLTTDAIKPSDLDPAVQRCIGAREGCTAYHVLLERIDRERKGSAVSDLFNFQRYTHETGWSFSALFILQDDRVTYKLWSGMPRIDRRMRQENPLGPVQEPASIIRNQLP